ncbi:MAG: SIS domain-containing protein [Candidatus Peribacteria bacterium]|nr:MAG: SIS domain-containing protein [Candidatus Peribacteria bacterium]
MKQYFEESALVKKQFIEDNVDMLDAVIECIKDCLVSGHKLLIAGNGGSAADAQHWATEIIARYKLERKSMAAIALTTDTSTITSIGNDFSFDEIFSKQIEGIGNAGDIFIGISTSGNSMNVIRAIEIAKEQGMMTIGLTGKGGGKMATMVDHNLLVPSDNTPRIQECHQTIYHTICEEVENRMFLN